jgi:integrase
MAGQIIKRGERNFIVRVYLGRDGNGKRDYLNQSVRGTKKDAQAVLNKLLRDKDTGTLLTPERMSLDEYLDRWLETAAKPGLRECSYNDYVWLMKCYVRPALGARQLARITPLDIQGLYGEMQGRGLSSRTVRYTHSVLRGALEQAVRWRLLTMNPASSVDLPRKEKKEMNAMNQEQASRFLAASASDSLHALFTLLLTTGLRPSEALALKWADLDLTTGKLSVRRTVTRRQGGGWYFEEPKTPKSRRQMDIPQSLVSLLLEHRAEQYPTGLELVFPNANGEPLTEHNVARRNFKRILKAAGLPDVFRLYDLRHTCATLLLLAGVHPKVVSERLGHSSIRETLDTYSHVLPSMQKQASDALEAMLFQADDTAAVRAYN